MATDCYLDSSTYAELFSSLFCVIRYLLIFPLQGEVGRDGQAGRPGIPGARGPSVRAL